MSEERMTKRAGKIEEGGRRRSGRPKLRWWTERDLKRAEVNS